MTKKAKSTAVLLAIIIFLGCMLHQEKQKLSLSDRPLAWQNIKHVVTIIFENASFENVYSQSFFKKIADENALMKNFYAITHPSQPNYIAMIAGSNFGIFSDANYTINARHLGDLLEEAGKTWKVYAEDYPGNCFLGARSGLYVRKHVPFLSFKNVSINPDRCGNVVEAEQFDDDIKNDNLPTFALYIPNLESDGHNTGMGFADSWFKRSFARYFENEELLKDTLFIVTFDEDDRLHFNRIYTAFLGAGVKKGVVSNTYHNHYSFLRTIEEIFELGTLDRNDKIAEPILNIWQ